MRTQTKLKKIRSLMQQQSIDCYLVPHTDEFSNEFLPPYSRRLEWISNFSGSAGDVLILQKKAYLLVDGRYTIQASQEVNKKCFHIFNYKDNSILNILSKTSNKNLTIGFDGNIEKFKKIKRLQNSLQRNFSFTAIKENLIDSIWKNRPKKIISTPFKYHKIFHGENKLIKIKKILNHINKNKVDAYVSTSCDSICWLFNIRAQDLEYSPLLMARSIIHKNGDCFIFSDQKSLKDEIVSGKIRIIYKSLEHFNNHFKENKDLVNSYLCAPNEISYNSFQSIKKISGRVVFKDNIIDNLKSIKNKIEQDGMRNAHIRDGITLTKFIYWIKRIQTKTINEISASDYLDNLRSKNKNFFSLSFPTIAGSGPNGAIVHYRASKKSNRKIKNNDLFLVDSGAQYFDGTTDVTRTIAFQKVTKEQIKMYTLVLKGHIAVASSIFSPNERGRLLDKKARKFLLNKKYNFDHGTGHGVGSFLNVHESPPSISKVSKSKFNKGMVVSNEPGFYKKNKFGIRIENLVLTKKLKNKYYFETLTLAPLEPKLIDYSLLTIQEKKWIKNYHNNVFKSLSNNLNHQEKKWLKNEISSLII